MKIIISGGGTGGHIYPALAIARGLMEKLPAVQILYVGTKNGMESDIVVRAGLNFASIDVAGINRTSLLKASQSIAKFPRGIFQAWDIMKKFQPEVVIGTGGYVAFPVLFVASMLSCRTIIHEQNALPGLANRYLAKRVDYTLLTFAEASQYLDAHRIILTGMPVRQEILNVKSTPRPSKYASDKFTIIAFGGSRGARSINQAMVNVVERYKDKNLQIIWITGENNYKEVRTKLDKKVNINNMKLELHLEPYMYNIEEPLATANLAICRAGASTISELAVLGLPAILIPYPYAADNHQEKNARALLTKNAIEMVIDQFLNGDTLYNMVEKLRSNPGRLQEMKNNITREAKPDALDAILNIIMGDN